MAETYITDGMLEMFLYESGQMLEQIEAITLEREKEGSFDEDSVNEIFRAMHTIKGSSGIMMYNDITKISHKLEDIFYYIRESKPTNIPMPELVANILDVTDFIKNELDKIRNGETPDGNSDSYVGKLEGFLETIKNNITSEGAELPPENTYKAPAQFYISPASSENSLFYLITIYYRNDVEMSNIRAYTAVYSLKEVAEDIRYIPEDIVSNEKSSEVIIRDGFQIALRTQIEQEEILHLIDHCAGVSNIEITQCDEAKFNQFGNETEGIEINLEGELPENSDVSVKDKKSTKKKPHEVNPLQAEVDESKRLMEQNAPVQALEKGSEQGSEQSKDATKGGTANTAAQTAAAQQRGQNQQTPAKQTFISVNVSKMDELMDLIGELVIAEAVVVQNPDLKAAAVDLTNFYKASSQLSKITSELQEVIMAMRMMPLSNTFQKMNRIVYDSSRKLDKDIELVIIGENTEVDKNIIEHISDPLMHLVRNSVDHGVESKEERALTGKPLKATVTIEAKNEGGKVWISVKDDGKGLDKEKILKKAIEHNLLGERNPKDLTEKEIFNFITLPGFSTNEQVTELSGRGVGMDVVLKNIQAIGGSLDIYSRAGQGSTMTIKIPLTLAIIDGIILGCGNMSYVVPTGDVKEFVRISNHNVVVEPEGTESIMLRGECYPVIRLKKFFNLKTGSDEIDKGIIAILEHEGKRLALYVDSLIGEQEIVVKPMPGYIKKTRGVSGCTQLGDGSISIILDTGTIMN